jgi:hypothetical protein
LIWSGICSKSFDTLPLWECPLGLGHVMLITPIFACNHYPPVLQHSLKQGNEDFQRLARALNSGDLAEAQKAFEAFKQDLQNIQRLKNWRQTAQPFHNRHPIEGAQIATKNDTGIGTYIDVIV